MPGPNKIRSLSQGGLERFHRATNAGNFKRKPRSSVGRIKRNESAPTMTEAERRASPYSSAVPYGLSIGAAMLAIAGKSTEGKR